MDLDGRIEPAARSGVAHVFIPMGAMSSMIATRTRAFAWAGLLVLAALIVGMAQLVPIRMGRQPDGSFLVSSGQRVEGGSIAFRGRPIDLAVHPRDAVFAVLNRSEVLLFDATGRVRRRASLFSLDGETTAGFRGLAWSPDGARLFASTSRGYVQAFAYRDGALKVAGKIPSSSRARGGTRSPAGWRSPATARDCSSPRPIATPSPRST